MNSQAKICAKNLLPEDVILLLQLLWHKEFLVCDPSDEKKIRQLYIAMTYLEGAKRYILNEKTKDSENYKVIEKQRKDFFEMEEI
jgi:hypothetical protein